MEIKKNSTDHGNECKINKKLVIKIAGTVVILIAAFLLLWTIIRENPQEVPDIETLQDSEAEPVKPNTLAQLHEKNSDVVGWIRFDNTKLNYPVMYTPNDEEKYLRRDFEGNHSTAGLPFIDKECKIDPESDNIIIYGHNMNNGTAFKALFNYEDEEYWRDNPTFYYATLDEERTYEVMAVFYDRVYYKHEDVFKFYQFIEPKDQKEFDEAMSNYREKSLYDTGVTAEYGDKLITLVTCSYQVENGRFVVVGKMVD